MHSNLSILASCQPRKYPSGLARSELIDHLIKRLSTIFQLKSSNNNPTSTLEIVDALSEGIQALVWLGNIGNASKAQSCPQLDFRDTAFKAQVDILANNPKVFG